MPGCRLRAGCGGEHVEVFGLEGGEGGARGRSRRGPASTRATKGLLQPCSLIPLSHSAPVIVPLWQTPPRHVTVTQRVFAIAQPLWLPTVSSWRESPHGESRHHRHGNHPRSPAESKPDERPRNTRQSASSAPPPPPRSQRGVPSVVSNRTDRPRTPACGGERGGGGGGHNPSQWLRRVCGWEPVTRGGGGGGASSPGAQKRRAPPQSAPMTEALNSPPGQEGVRPTYLTQTDPRDTVIT